MIIAHLITGLVSIIAPRQMSFEALPQPWACIAFYESTDNTQAVNPVSGDSGAFQFQASTWQEYAPISFPTSPLNASLLQQFEVAKMVYLQQGSGAWQTWNLCQIGGGNGS
jgi:hypothetical protein